MLKNKAIMKRNQCEL